MPATDAGMDPSAPRLCRDVPQEEAAKTWPAKSDGTSPSNPSSTGQVEQLHIYCQPLEAPGGGGDGPEVREGRLKLLRSGLAELGVGKR